MKLYIFAFNLKMCKKKQAADIPKWVLTIKWMSDSCIRYEFVIFYFQHQDNQMLDEYEKISQLIDESTERKLNTSTCLQAEMT